MSDSARARTALIRRVARAGYHVIAGPPCEDAVVRAARSPIGAVVWHLADRVKGRISTLWNRLREHHADACLIVVGPDRGAEWTANLLRAGAFDYVTVPVRPGRLEASLRQGMEIRQSFLHVRDLSQRLQLANAELGRERDSLQRLNRNLVLLNELAQALAGSLDAEEIVRMAGDRLAQILGIDVLAVLWLEPRRVWAHAPTEQGRVTIDQARRALLASDRNPPSHAERGRFASGRPTLVDDAPCLDMPLTVGGKPVGLIRLQRINKEPFDASQTELVKAVATSLALALRNADAHSQVRNLALTDGLTNLLNRRAFSVMLTRAFMEAERYRTPLCLIMADVDHFKSLNDRFGHLMGDRLLQETATLISQAIRTADVAARYGGEEFAIILPRTDLAQAMILAARIRETLQHHPFDIHGTRITLTLSLGIARAPHPAMATADDLVAAADAALYEAKARGRNRVEVHHVCHDPAADAALCSVESAGVEPRQDHGGHACRLLNRTMAV
jgi:diguanylate cyclase (GGDEF)-like protein